MADPSKPKAPPPVPKKSTKPPLPTKPSTKPPPPVKASKKEPSVMEAEIIPESEPAPVVPPATPSNAETLEIKPRKPERSGGSRFDLASDTSDTKAAKKTNPSEPPGPIKPALSAPRGLWLVELRERADKLLADVKERTKDKPRWFLPAVSGGAGLCVLILVLAAGKAACGSSSSAAEPTSANSAGTIASSSAAPVAPAPPMMCALAGERRSIAPRALAASGVEVAVLGSEIAVGFASTANDAKVEILDSNGANATSVLAQSKYPIRRVLALSRTSAALDVDRAKDPLHSRRTLVADPPVDVGGTSDGFGWAPHKSDKVSKLWALPQAGVAVEQVRGDVLPDGKGFAIAFRQGSVVYAGAFGGSPAAPLGPLVHVDGLGPNGGAPVVAASGDRVMIAWSDRATTNDPWHLRTATFRVGDAAAQPHAFAAPPGGLGEQTMSPDLTSLGGGRFLLLWTEGGTSHQVRGTVLNEEGAPSSAFAVSPDGVDAGQGQSAVLEDGRGVVAYLSSTEPGFYEAITAPIRCVEKK